MTTGRWLEPRYTDRAVFEKDYPSIDLNGPDVYCPGCKSMLKLARRNPIPKIAGWCKGCNRAVTI